MWIQIWILEVKAAGFQGCHVVTPDFQVQIYGLFSAVSFLPALGGMF